MTGIQVNRDSPSAAAAMQLVVGDKWPNYPRLVCSRADRGPYGPRYLYNGISIATKRFVADSNDRDIP